MNRNMLMIGSLGIILLLITWVLYRRNQDRDSKIDLDDLLIGPDGTISRGAVMILGAFLMSTWLMIKLALDGKMSEGYLTIYNATWVAPILLQAVLNRPAAPPPPSGPSTTINTDQVVMKTNTPQP